MLLIVSNTRNISLVFVLCSGVLASHSDVLSDEKSKAFLKVPDEKASKLSKATSNVGNASHISNHSIVKRGAKRKHTVIKTEEGTIDLDREYDDTVDDDFLPRYHKLNRKLWGHRYWLVPLFVFCLLLFFALTLAIVFCGKMCSECLRRVTSVLCMYCDKIRCRDPNYREFTDLFERLGYEPPPYEHYLQLRDAFGIKGPM